MVPKDVQGAMDNVDRSWFEVADWALIHNHITTQDAEIERLKAELLDSKQAHVLRAETYEVLRSTNAAMVAKLRELLTEWETCAPKRTQFDEGYSVGLAHCADQITDILPAEPASPAPVDIETVREVIYELTRKEVLHAPYVMRCASKLSAAIGEG